MRTINRCRQLEKMRRRSTQRQSAVAWNLSTGGILIYVLWRASSKDRAEEANAHGGKFPNRYAATIAHSGDNWPKVTLRGEWSGARNHHLPAHGATPDLSAQKYFTSLAQRRVAITVQCGACCDSH